MGKVTVRVLSDVMVVSLWNACGEDPGAVERTCCSPHYGAYRKPQHRYCCAYAAVVTSEFYSPVNCTNWGPCLTQTESIPMTHQSLNFAGVFTLLPRGGLCGSDDR
jgi:hypothetical protein